MAALEVMSRFAIDPKWLLYLPPTMSPSETSDLEGYLEHPEDAIRYYQKKGVSQLVCEEKHMGSRVVIVLCRDATVAQKRFGVLGKEQGVCYTRTGRKFFRDSQIEAKFLQRVSQALENCSFWEKYQTDWLCLDAELLPWSVKAQALLQEQYAAVGAAAENSIQASITELQRVKDRGIADTGELLQTYTNKQDVVGRYIDAYRKYCWDVESIEDYKLAPFHILATEGKVHVDKNHQWHMQAIREICIADEKIFRVTPYRIIDIKNETSIQTAIDWWSELTAKGGEGMVVKPYDFISYGKGGLLQPAVKCRGKEYLRIIYGAEYDLPENLTRLRQRGLSRKRSLALQEFALGVEGLERFVRKEPLRRVHESVFAVLALESEEVDPRL